MDVHEIRRPLYDAGLRRIATQADYTAGVADDPGPAIRRPGACGAHDLTCALILKWVDSETRLERLAHDPGVIAERVQNAGLTFCFHPIAPDYLSMNGGPIYRRLMDVLPDRGRLTLCAFAAFSARIDPEECLSSFAHRVDLVHFKDDHETANGDRVLVPLGQGTRD